MARRPPPVGARPPLSPRVLSPRGARPPSLGPSPRGPSPRGPAPGVPLPRVPGNAPGALSPGVRSPSGGGAPPAGPPPPPPAPAEAPPADISRKNEDLHKQLLQELMDKKLAEWNRMMTAPKAEDRKEGYEAFKKISEEEVTLATRSMSKSKLKEFLDLKMRYFDQLANDNSQDVRVEGLRNFKKLCDDEINLARSVGPKDPLEEATQRTPTTASEEPKLQRSEATKPTAPLAQHPEQVPAPQTQPTSQFPTALSIQPQPIQPPSVPSSPAPSPQIVQLSPSMLPPHLPGPLGVAPPMVNVPLMVPPQLLGQFLPNARATNAAVPHQPFRFSTDKTEKPTASADAGAKGTEPLDDNLSAVLAKAPKADDVDGRLKLLHQLESARKVLENRPPVSTPSVAEEIKRRLCKINRMQMQVIDDILGGRTDQTSEFVSELTVEVERIKGEPKPRRQRKDTRERTQAKDVTETKNDSDSDEPNEDEEQPAKDRVKGKESKKDKSPQPPKAPTKTASVTHHRIVLEIPALKEAASPVPTPEKEAVTIVSHCVCTGNTELCLLDKERVEVQSRPHVIWERPQSRSRSVVQRRPRPEVEFPPEEVPPPEPPWPPYSRSDRYDWTHRSDPVARQPYDRASFYSIPPPQDPPSSFYPPAIYPYPSYPITPPTLMPPSANNFMSSAVSSAAIGIQTVAEMRPPLPENVPIMRQERGVDAEMGFQDVAQYLKRSYNVPMKAMTEVGIDAAGSICEQPPPTDTLVARTTIILNSDSQGVGNQPVFDYNRCTEGLRRISASVDDLIDSLSTLSDYASPCKGKKEVGYSDNYSDFEDYGTPRDPCHSSRRSRPDRRRSRSRYSNAPQREKSRREYSPSLWGWLCGAVRGKRGESPAKSRSRGKSDARIDQVSVRIRELITEVIRVSNDVIEARKTIQMTGLKGSKTMVNIFAAENKLWELIDLELQLANELAQYRIYDPGTDQEYISGLMQAEEKIRHLIEVETQLAKEIGEWRRALNQNLKSAAPTCGGLTGMSHSGFLPAPAQDVLTPTSTSTTSLYASV